MQLKNQHPFYGIENLTTFNDDWFKAVFNASRDGFAIELNEVIIYVNNAFLTLYGYSSKEELIGQKISLVHAEESNDMMLDFGRRRINGEPVPDVYEARGRRKDGTIIDIEVTASVLSINGISYIIDVNRNISERKNFERELQEKNDQLQKINSELDRFVYSASHDLRAPLRSLLGLVNLLRTDSNPVNSIEYFKRMEKSIHSLDNFIQSILHYSRNSRIEVFPEPIHLREKIESVIESLKYDEDNEKVQVHIEINETHPLISDRYRLRVILNNLISNAFRYKDPNKSIHTLHIQADVDAHVAYITIIDNGCGIAHEHLDKIFDMFYRAHNKSVGSGLGLYIARESVKMLQGAIFVTSELNAYTRFDISIPNLAVAPVNELHQTT